MARKPPGLKVFPQRWTGVALQQLQENCRALPPPPYNPLFRYFGFFGVRAPRVEGVLPWMERVGEALFRDGLMDGPPNQFRVTRWTGDLAASFKWHIDNHRHGEEILVISLTDGRSIGFRDPRRPNDDPFVLKLDAGDIYVIRGPSRWKWEHKVMPTGRDRDGGESFVVAYRRVGSLGAP